ncbi:conserved hypothetical protein [Histoplasma capsulatum var. duboisii H88]|uniref:Zn(2)-C6 fungal-type domain-containing protein n=1 Tax=Ajellomyces capsulatus (strain H88) TaxID=544711 RepID=F0UKN3_AJEC8|nr:conserved hypothetical protein [Histoplasma capsulatum var. duboisii H88]
MTSSQNDKGLGELASLFESENGSQSPTMALGQDAFLAELAHDAPAIEHQHDAPSPERVKKRLFSGADTETEDAYESKRVKLDMYEKVNSFNLRQRIDTSVKMKNLRAIPKKKTNDKGKGEKPEEVGQLTEDEQSGDELTEWDVLTEDELPPDDELNRLRQELNDKEEELARAKARTEHARGLAKARGAMEAAGAEGVEGGEGDEGGETGGSKKAASKKKSEIEKKAPRSVEACNMCKIKKIRCSANRIACKSCRQANELCCFTHPTTGESFLRGWRVSRFGDVVKELGQLRKENEELRKHSDMLERKCGQDSEVKSLLDEWRRQEKAKDDARMKARKERLKYQRKFKKEYLRMKAAVMAKAIETENKDTQKLAGTGAGTQHENQPQHVPADNSMAPIILIRMEDCHPLYLEPPALQGAKTFPDFLPQHSLDFALDPELTKPRQRNRQQPRQPQQPRTRGRNPPARQPPHPSQGMGEASTKQNVDPRTQQTEHGIFVDPQDLQLKPEMPRQPTHEHPERDLPPQRTKKQFDDIRDSEF